MKSDVEMLEGLALRLIQGMEELKIHWWVFNGFSIRKLHQLALEVNVDGRRSEDREQEHRPGGELEAEVASNVDDGDCGSRPYRECVQVFSTKSSKKAIKTPAKSRLGTRARRRLKRRGWR